MADITANRRGLTRRQYGYLVVYVLGLVVAAIFVHEAAHVAAALIQGVPFGELKIGFWGINPSVTLPPGLDESVKTPVFYAGGFTTGVLLVLFYFLYWVRKYHREAAKTSFRHHEESEAAKTSFCHREEGEARRGDLIHTVQNETATPAPQARSDEKRGHRENGESNSCQPRLTWAMGLATVAIVAMEFASGYLEGRFHSAYLYGATTLLSPTHLLTIGWVLSAVVMHIGFCPRKKLVGPAEP
ncbi:MAG: hypothetical protein JW954_01765 [Dehalococcoidaceae bacterium]|nr:hypothetical protein [Dehalococcoidaceae bacterium]